MHALYVEDSRGDPVDILPFCSDWCHRAYCDEYSGVHYEGWNGCIEASYDTECAKCGAPIKGVNGD